jgi:hypothetical protein
VGGAHPLGSCSGRAGRRGGGAKFVRPFAGEEGAGEERLEQGPVTA